MLEREAFDLVLLDIAMPEMDGFQVLERLLANSRLRDLPVIVTSAVEGLDSVRALHRARGRGYLTSRQPVLLKARIGAGLEKKRLRDQQKELVRRFRRAEVAQDLQESGFALGASASTPRLMFVDIRGFTTLAESQPPEETIELLNTCTR